MNKIYEFFKEKIYDLCLISNRPIEDEEEKMLKTLKLFESSCRLMMESYNYEENSSKLVLIQDLDVSIRTINSLMRAGYRTLDDIINSSVYDLIRIRNLGKKSLNEIIQIVKEYGFELPQYRKKVKR